MIIAIVDANVFVSGLMFARSIPGRVVDAWIQGRFVLALSLELRAEILHAFDYPRVRKYPSVNDASVAGLMAAIDARALIVTPAKLAGPVSRDPKDDPLIAAALGCNATHIVTGDKDLLVLGTFEGVRIVKPADFLDELAV